MSMRYTGGVLSSTAPTVTTSSAQGMWTLSEQAQYQQQGVWPNALVPTTIGQAFGGGFYAGKISVSGDGVATHLLIVAPKSSGQATKTWGEYEVSSGVTSPINGPVNTASLVALGSAYQAAIFCNDLNAGAGLNGYTDWYLPSLNELGVMYYFLKPGTNANFIYGGSNANSVSPQPLNQNYTSGLPAQTTATGVDGFRSGEANAFDLNRYWASSEYSAYAGHFVSFNNGEPSGWIKYNNQTVRAVRRIPI